MNFMIAFGIASVVLCIGMVLRAKIPFLRNMLVPASVIAGIIGLLLMNTNLISTASAEMYTIIVNFLFTITFISIGLTSSASSKNSKRSAGKEIAKGSIGMGMIWNILYALTPVLGVIVVLIIGGYFSMDAVYGLLLPFAFAQGPGQAAVFGTIFEQQYGIENAAMVGLTFAVIGFIACFLVGVPIAKYGIKKGLAKNIEQNKLDGYVERGYFLKEDRKISIGNETVYSGNMDTMTFHFAIIGICFLLALGMAELVSFLPGIGSSLSGFLFIYGMLAGYLVKFIMKKIQIDNLLDNTFQTKITGWSTDYLVVSSFMAVKFSIIATWAVPILILSIITVLISFLIVMYLGKRLGGEDDFARTLGLYGTVTGTVPSGIALIRIIDPSLRTNAAVELGLMNVPMMASFVTVSVILSIASGALSLSVGIPLLLAPIPVYLIILKLLGLWGKKTFDLKTNQADSKIYIRPERKEII